jgi:hypothetical protein
MHFNWDVTFRHMVARRLQRELGGTFQKERTLSTWKLTTILFVVVAVGIVTFNFGSTPTATVAEEQPWPNQTLYAQTDFSLTFSINIEKIFKQNLLDAVGWLLVGLVVIGVSLKVVEVVRWCVFWLLLGVIAYLVLQGVPSVRADPQHQFYIHLNLGLTLGFEVATVLTWILYHILYPKAIDKRWWPFDDASRYWSVKPMEGQPSKFTYAPSKVWPLSGWLGVPDRCFGYEGELDAHGRPHGMGTWHDTAKHGETLQGVWRHGFPAGPFRATEYASGFTCVSVRIAFAHSRVEESIYDCFWSPGRHPRGLHWGVAAVECSVAGHFFKNLPSIHLLADPDPDRDAIWCLGELRSGEGASHPTHLVVSAGSDAVEVSGYELQASPDLPVYCCVRGERSRRR